MTPKQHEIDLSNGPVLDVVFSQFKTDVNVSVICIGSHFFATTLFYNVGILYVLILHYCSKHKSNLGHYYFS